MAGEEERGVVRVKVKVGCERRWLVAASCAVNPVLVVFTSLSEQLTPQQVILDTVGSAGLRR